MVGLIKNEIFKTLHLKKYLLVFIAIVLLEIIAVAQLKLKSDTMNAQSLFFVLMNFLPFIYALFISVYISDTLTEESKTIKLTLTRSVKRHQLLNAKFITYAIFSFIVVLFSIVSSLILGAVFLGFEGDIYLNGGALPHANIFILYMNVFAGIVLPMLGFGLVVIFIAVLSDNTGITIGVSLGITLVSQILEATKHVKEYSIVYQLQTLYQRFIMNQGVYAALAIVGGYIIAFYILSCWIFRKKDVLT